MVSSLVPKSDVITHKRLKNLRKLQERRKKLGDRQNGDDDDGDSDDGLGFQLKSKPKTIDEILADSDDDMEVDQVRKNSPFKP
jgi:ribosomal RNA-processing protein 12